MNQLKPGLMRLEGKILRDQVNELREQIAVLEMNALLCWSSTSHEPTLPS